MTKQEILDKFNDIDFVYNDSSKHETLSRMLDELLKEQQEQIDRLIEENASNAEMAEGLKELLKEQKAVEPKKAPFPDASRSDGSWYFICGACSKPIDPIDKYCRECGRPVLWKGR